MKVTDPPLIRVSERKMFRRCPWLWWQTYREGLIGKGRPADALWFGTGIHIALADWYGMGFKRGIHPADTFALWANDEIRQIKASPQTTEEGYSVPVYEDARELGMAMLIAYIEKYGRDRDLETLAIEQTFEIEVWKDGKVIAILMGTFDGVHLDHSDGAFYLKEHKTASAIATAFLALDDQAGTYFSVATIVLRSQGVLGPHEGIAGIEYNYLRKVKPDIRPRDERGNYLNKNGEISKQQPSPAFHREIIERSPGEINTQMRRLADEVFIMNGMRTGAIPVYKNTTWECPRCPFFEMCQLDEKGNTKSVEQYKRLMYVRRDPYFMYRKSASELCQQRWDGSDAYSLIRQARQFTSMTCSRSRSITRKLILEGSHAATQGQRR